MKKIKRNKLPQELKDEVAHPLDEDYRPANQGGCWICNRGNGWEETDEFEFSLEFDAFYHKRHVDELGLNEDRPLLDFEERLYEGRNT